MAAGRTSSAGAGTNTTAFANGGGTIVVTTEEWSGVASVETVAFD